MKIKTKFQIIVPLVLSLALLLCGVIFFTVQDMNETMEKNRIANEIIKDVFELNIVGHDYVMYHEERAKTQWQLKYDSVAMLLTQASEKSKDPEEQAIVTDLFKNHESIDSIFSQLVSNYEKENLGGEESAVLLELEERLTSRLEVNSQVMVSGASQLGAVTSVEVVTAQQRINLLATTFIVLMSAVIATILVWVSKGILKPITQFRKGTEIIAKGDLDYKIGITKRDEIGDLAKSFESMSLNLKKSYDELESRVEERTAELAAANEQLRREITARKRAEEGLRRMSKVFMDSADPIIIEDLAGNVVEMNDEAERAYGWKREELIGKPIKTIVPLEHHKQADELLAQFKQGGDIRNVEGLRCRKSGKVCPVLLTLSLLVDEEGKPLGVATIAKDITEIKRAEEALQNANIRLKELDKLKSMFIASMSHELRTPLNSIIGFTGVMLQGVAGEITEEQRKQLTMVKNSANHLLALINDIIDVSKIETGKIELDIEEFNLSNIAQEIKDSFKVAAEEKGLELSLEMSENLVIKSDERRTKQIIINFVNNAMKFTDKGKVEMKVAKEDGKVEVSVRDTGIGIKKEHMGMLFKAFSQTPTEGKPKQEGTGLGLYLSKKIVDLLGGEIKAESEFGKGSVFTLTLPLEYKEVKK